MRNILIKINHRLKFFQLKALLPFLPIFFLMIGAYAFAYFHPLSWESFKEFHLQLKIFGESHPVATPLIFMSIYILYALLSLPGIFILSLIAGFIFAQPFSTLYAAVASTIGASLLFLVARSAFGSLFYKRPGHFLNRMEKGFHENAISYLLFLRLIPFSPFWMVNLASAFFRISFWVFIWTTFVGMIPSIFVYTQAGKGITLLLERPDPLTPLHLLNPPIVIALVGLALLSLLPILFNRKRDL